MVFTNFEQLIEKVKAYPAMRKMAVAVAHDEHTLEAVMNAKKEGIANPILVGDKNIYQLLFLRQQF